MKKEEPTMLYVYKVKNVNEFGAWELEKTPLSKIDLFDKDTE